MKKWLFLILLFPLICVAQTYRYLGVEDGLSNRRVTAFKKIKPDTCGSSRTKVLIDTMEKSLNDIS
jgi:hypothetical protein